MKKQNKGFFLMFLAFFMCSNAFSVSIASQVVQHDTTHDEVRAISLLVEETFMDFFFERGFVITNLPAEISENSSQDKKALKSGLLSADEGMCKYFIQLVIDYKNNSNSPEAFLLSNIKDIQWKIYDVKTEQVLKSGKNIVGSIMQNENSENGIKSFTDEISNSVYKYLMEK